MEIDIDIDKMDQRINALGAALSFHPVTLETAGAAGFDDAIVLYAGGRAGAMGNVAAEQVQSAFGFFSPDAVTTIWPTVLAAGPPTEINAVYTAAIAATARATWPVGPAAVVTTIGREVVESVPLFGLALFSAWRSLTLPDDDHGAAAVVVETLRELRGDINLQAVALSGMSPLEADLATTGDDRALLHGWRGPFPEVAHLADAVNQVQVQTSRRMAEIYARIDDDKVAALSDAVAELAQTLTA